MATRKCVFGLAVYADELPFFKFSPCPLVLLLVFFFRALRIVCFVIPIVVVAVGVQQGVCFSIEGYLLCIWGCFMVHGLWAVVLWMCVRRTWQKRGVGVHHLLESMTEY